MPSDGREPYRASIYDETPDFTRVLADRQRARTRKNGAGKANGAQGRNRIVYDAIDLKRFFEWLFL
jgi:hypothetical protein